MSAKITLLQDLGLLIRSGDLSFETKGWEQKHVLFGGPRVCQYAPGELATWAPTLDNGLARLHVFSSAESPAEVLRHTRWIVFIGAVLSPELLYMAMQNCLIFVFTPRMDQLETLLEGLDIKLLLRKNIFFFCGDLNTMEQPLRELIPPAATSFGPPAIYMAYRSCPWLYARQIWDTVEIVYYHEALYPHEGRCHAADPRRPLAGGFGFVQQKHLMENLCLLRTASTVEALRQQCAGKPALLVAAGSALDAQLADIARLREHCVLICANKASAVLLRHDIVPDIVLLLDSSAASAHELDALPPLPETVLVAYTLSGARHGRMGHVCFFGFELEQLHLPHGMIEHLGSVINYQMYIADVLGCKDIVVAGLSLCAASAYGGGYADGTSPANAADIQWRFPVEVGEGVGTNEAGRQCYTSLNFLDVANWLHAFMQKKSMRAVNMTKDSLFTGSGITYDPHPQLDTPPLQRPLFSRQPGVGQESLQAIEKALHTYATYWSAAAQQCEELLAASDADILDQFLPLLQTLDSNGTSTLLTGFPPFQPLAQQFQTMLLDGTEAEQIKAARLYLEHLREAAKQLLTLG